MEIRELRIGNTIKRPHSLTMKPIIFPDKIDIVKGITVFGELDFTTATSLGDTVIPAIHCIGIEITEEWLLKFGFQKDKQGLFYFDSGGDFVGEFVVRFLFRDDIDVAPFAKRNPKPDSIFESISIKYVHELQNLYFALTGTEL